MEHIGYADNFQIWFTKIYACIFVDLYTLITMNQNNLKNYLVEGNEIDGIIINPWIIPIKHENHIYFSIKHN